MEGRATLPLIGDGEAVDKRRRNAATLSFHYSARGGADGEGGPSGGGEGEQEESTGKWSACQHTNTCTRIQKSFIYIFHAVFRWLILKHLHDQVLTDEKSGICLCLHSVSFIP